MTDGAYARAGVDLEEGSRAVRLIGDAVRSTHGPDVLAGVGAFGGMMRATALRGLNDPVLVASIDGVGTKTMVASRLHRWDGIGADLVNHCVNDILVQGARPLFFLDYVASSILDADQIAAVVAGMAGACRANGCALLGGETAEMPGVYREGEIDLVGAVVGVVDRRDVIDGSRVEVGDVLIGLPSTGLHTNGYSLARAVLDGLDWSVPRDDLQGATIGEALLAPHASYLADVGALRTAAVDVRAIAHITGGGLPGNVPRSLPDETTGRIRPGTWAEPPIFDLIRRTGAIDEGEMRRAFNLGVGAVIVVARADATHALLPGASIVGDVVERRAGAAVVFEAA